MSDTYVECLVKAKPSWIGKFFKMLLIMLTVVFVLAIFVLPPLMMFAFIGAIITGVEIGRAHV